MKNPQGDIAIPESGLFYAYAFGWERHGENQTEGNYWLIKYCSSYKANGFWKY